jgi:predicted MFS family arabinose efflux permease
VVAAIGAGAAFILNALSFVGVIWFLLRWKRRAPESPANAERVARSIVTGLDHCRRSRAARAVLVRTGAFSVFAAALWAMLPLLALNHGSIGYGALLAALGVGAVLGAAVLPIARRAFSTNVVVALATVVYAIVTAAAGRIGNFGVLCAVLVAGGIAWIALLASFNYCAQVMSPNWLRARSISIYLLILQGGFAGGSALWGAVAERIGIADALLAAALGLLVALLLVTRFELQTTPAAEVTPLATSH